MKRLEIIQLRLAGIVPANLLNDIRRSVLTGTETDTVGIYFHATIPTDLIIHIQTETKTRDTHTSDFGLRLAAVLREYGMVQHTVWIEDQRK